MRPKPFAACKLHDMVTTHIKAYHPSSLLCPLPGLPVWGHCHVPGRVGREGENSSVVRRVDELMNSLNLFEFDMMQGSKDLDFLGRGVGWIFSSVSPTAPSPMRGISAASHLKARAGIGRIVEISDRSGRNKLPSTGPGESKQREIRSSTLRSSAAAQERTCTLRHGLF